ncbi:MAG: hypothetical protein U0871_09510 [Gemmataceae bacterium]
MGDRPALPAGREGQAGAAGRPGYVRELLALTRARLQEATGLDARERHELRAAVRAAGLTPPDDWYAPSATAGRPGSTTACSDALPRPQLPPRRPAH